jgi:hypothetical protein
MTVPLRELGAFERVAEDDIIYHKDLRGVEYVVADVGGHLAAPVYGMMQVQDLLREKGYVTPDGVDLMEDGRAYWIGPPPNDVNSGFEWAGEWTVTYETFRDMGAAFAVALVLIYMLVVWEFGNFRIPALIMAPIPLTLLGIVPAHLLFFQFGEGGEFTATSMIGWIALAGIIVRNSILLVDFSIHEVQKGVPVREAVIKACKTRTRPILITAFALVAGSSVILTDPIFQGMAISLASGVLVSTVLTLVVIPLGTIEAKQALYEVAAAGMPPGEPLPIPEDEFVPEAEEETAPRARGGLLISLWGKIAGVLLMVFYAIRGLFLLVGQVFRKARARGKQSPPSVPPPATGEAGGAGPGPAGGAPSAGGPVVPPAGVPPATAAPVMAEAPAAERREPEPVPQEAAPVRPPPPPRLRTASSLTDAEREHILSKPETFGHLPRGKDDIIQTSEASATDLAAISAPIRKEDETADEAGRAPQPTSRSTLADHPPSKSEGPTAPSRKGGGPKVVKTARSTGKKAKTAKPKAPTQIKPRAAASAQQSGADGNQDQAGRPTRKGGRRGIRLKDKLPGKTDLGIG